MLLGFEPLACVVWPGYGVVDDGMGVGVWAWMERKDMDLLGQADGLIYHEVVGRDLIPIPMFSLSLVLSLRMCVTNAQGVNHHLLTRLWKHAKSTILLSMLYTNI